MICQENNRFFFCFFLAFLKPQTGFGRRKWGCSNHFISIYWSCLKMRIFHASYDYLSEKTLDACSLGIVVRVDPESRQLGVRRGIWAFSRWILRWQQNLCDTIVFSCSSCSIRRQSGSSDTGCSSCCLVSCLICSNVIRSIVERWCRILWAPIVPVPMSLGMPYFCVAPSISGAFVSLSSRFLLQTWGEAL